MLKKRGPAFAGLFFALITTGALNSQPAKLSPAGQRYFRTFLENFTPIVLKREKQRKGANYRASAGNYRWGDKNRDCAGLVRYLFWEAMQPHDKVFSAEYSGLSGLAPYSNPPELLMISKDWAAMNFTAQQLKARATFRSRVIQQDQLKTGDLLFFESAELQIRHAMLVIRSGSAIYLVYHTGDERDELRVRTLADLKALPGTEWHPESANPVFQGFFRPQFLE